MRALWPSGKSITNSLSPHRLRQRPVPKNAKIAGLRNGEMGNLRFAGKVDEIMIDIPTGRAAYAVLSFGGFLRMGNKLFAVPWDVLAVDEDQKCFILDVEKSRLEKLLDSTKTIGRIWQIEALERRSTATMGERRTEKVLNTRPIESALDRPQQNSEIR